MIAMIREGRPDAMDDVRWADEIDAAVTVLDARGVITYMNRRSQEVYAAEGGAALIGKSAFDCHPKPARAKLQAILETRRPNHYTIRKRGQKKIIHQVPRLRDGVLVGVVEVSVPIPDEMPHFDRK